MERTARLESKCGLMVSKGKKIGSSSLAECTLVEVLAHVASRVPALAAGIIVCDEQGGSNTSIIVHGNSATTLGLGRLAYLMARMKSKVVLITGEDMIDDLVAPSFDGELILDDMSISDLMDHVRNEADALACGVCIPDDGNSSRTTTYITGSASEVKGLADTLAESAEDACLQQMVDEAALDEEEKEDDGSGD